MENRTTSTGATQSPAVDPGTAKLLRRWRQRRWPQVIGKIPGDLLYIAIVEIASVAVEPCNSTVKHQGLTGNKHYSSSRVVISSTPRSAPSRLEYQRSALETTAQEAVAAAVCGERAGVRMGPKAAERGGARGMGRSSRAPSRRMLSERARE